MNYKRLGRSGLMCSRLGLRIFNFGGPPTRQGRLILDAAALNFGINLIDTVDTYPGPVTGSSEIGRTEEILGAWLAEGRHLARSGRSRAEGLRADRPGPNDAGLSARHLRRALDDSL
jgi:NDP-hexose C3-ketoreductase / dTDP-4-oxo-2-deoxy-alpha-D-pentos-2-ene 2,3-reductase